MSSSMDNKKHVLVVGNGFDLAIGRKTSYWDFFQSGYCPKNYPAPLISYLNKTLDNEHIRWYDLETALQNYAIEANKLGKGDESFFSDDEKKVICSLKGIVFEPAISNYHDLETGIENFDAIEKQLIKKGVLYQDKWGVTQVPLERDEIFMTCIERDRVALKKIEEGLAAYLNSMDYKHPESTCLADYIMRNALENENAVIYMFNYTAIGGDVLKEDCFAEGYDKRIHHIHGSLKGNHIIIGAKDGDYGDYNFVQKAFDPQFGSTSLVRDLLDADEVEIYGHSLGDCDSQYFMPFFLQQVQPTAKKKTIKIYTYDEKSRENIKSNIQKLTGNKLSWLYSMNDFNIFTQKDMDCMLPVS